MIIYRFKAYDHKGKIHTGNLILPNEEEAISFLLRNNLTPVEVKLLPQTHLFKIFFKLFFKINFKQKIFLIKEIRLILKSGLGLEKGLAILINEAKGGLRDFLFYLSYNLQKGEPFYKTFADFSDVFSQVEIETIRAGELSGNLVENLARLEESLERQREIKSEIISNIIYPAIVLSLAFVVLIILIIFVMPKISILLSQLTVQPPLLTKVMIIISNFINKNLNWFIILMVFLILFTLFILFYKKTRRFLFKKIMKMPLLRVIYLDLSLSQILFILRSLLNSGIHLTQALRLAGYSTFHPQLRDALLRVEENLKSGKKFSEALIYEEEIPIFLSNILGIASESGTLEETLKTMEEFYLDEFRRKIKNLLTLFQPLLLIFVGGIVGFVAVAVLVPIYQQISTQLQLQEGRGRLPGGF